MITAPPPAELPDPTTTRPESTPPPIAEPPRRPASAASLEGDALTQRVRDARRLLLSGNDWTLQFMVTCKTESAQRVLAQVGGDPRLHLLPLQYNGQSCFRVCWDSYRSREAAVSASGLPPALVGINREPIPRRIADLIP